MLKSKHQPTCQKEQTKIAGLEGTITELKEEIKTVQLLLNDSGGYGKAQCTARGDDANDNSSGKKLQCCDGSGWGEKPCRNGDDICYYCPPDEYTCTAPGDDANDNNSGLKLPCCDRSAWEEKTCRETDICSYCPKVYRRCEPSFTNQDDQIARNQDDPLCNNIIEFQPGPRDGKVTITWPFQPDSGNCAYASANTCGSYPIMMSQIRVILMDVKIEAGSCDADFVAVYMFEEDNWDQGREIDLMEVAGTSGRGVIRSNWAGQGQEKPWKNKFGEYQKVDEQVYKHVQFYSSVSNGRYNWQSTACDHSSIKSGVCPPGDPSTSTATYNPPYFDSRMIIVADNWGKNAKNGCKFSVINFQVDIRKDNFKCYHGGCPMRGAGNYAITCPDLEKTFDGKACALCQGFWLDCSEFHPNSL